jgi:Barstar (barnase inhibitor)
MGKLLERMKDASRSGVYRAGTDQVVLEVARGSGLEVFTLDLHGKKDKQSFLDEIARVLAFPRWFGGNWDALEDCLLDLSWSKGEGWLLIFKGFAGLPADDLGVLTDVLASAAEYWAERGRLFFAVFIDPQRSLALPDLYKEKLRGP